MGCWLKMVRGLVVSSAFAFPLTSVAWTNSLVLQNYLPHPVQFQLQSSEGELTSTCPDGALHGTIPPNSPSCAFNVTTSGLGMSARGSVALGVGDDLGCSTSYSYDFWDSKTASDMASLRFSDFSCGANASLNSTNLYANSPHLQASMRQLADSIFNIAKPTAFKVPISLALADCSNGIPGNATIANCINVVPTYRSSETPFAASIQDSLILQEMLGYGEPLSNSQFFGTHNSAVGPHYTASSELFNMSESDPDNVATLTAQLELGARQLELDIVYYKDQVMICHNHVKDILDPILCDGNPALRDVLPEIRSWSSAHPDTFLLLYLDANLPFTGHVPDLDGALAVLDDLIFTPAMAQQSFGSQGNTLPVTTLTRRQVLNTFKRNIIVINDNDTVNLGMSKYVFVAAAGTTADLPYEHGMDTFLQDGISCAGDQKYAATTALYTPDTFHRTLWRLNGDRTTVNYVQCSDGVYTYSDYSTPQFITSTLRCPVNIYSLNMLGSTDGSSDPKVLDPRVFAFLWSWDYGFPQSNGSDLAHLDPASGRYRNDVSARESVVALCRKNGADAGSGAWFTVTVPGEKLHDAATQACAAGDGSFAVPPTSYELDDALRMLHGGKNIPSSPVFVNYQRVANTWIANDGEMLQ